MKSKLTIIGLLVAAFIQGCAYNRSVTLETTNPKTGEIVKKTTARAYTLFDSQSALTGVQVKVGDTNGANGTFIASLNQQAQTTTNFNAMVGTIIESAVAGAVKGAK